MIMILSNLFIPQSRNRVVVDVHWNSIWSLLVQCVWVDLLLGTDTHKTNFKGFFLALSAVAGLLPCKGVTLRIFVLELL